MSKKKLKEFIVYTQILQNRLVYIDFRKFEDKFTRLKNDNENEWVEVHYKVVDKVAYFFHKYYRGALLPVLAQSEGIHEQNKLHIHLKHEFLYKRIPSGNWTDIPQRYLTGVGIALIEEANLYNVDILSGTTIIVVKDNVIIGVIPSHAVITNREMEKFIKKCEDTQNGMIDFVVPPELLELRDLAYKAINEERQGEMFESVS